MAVRTLRCTQSGMQVSRNENPTRQSAQGDLYAEPLPAAPNRATQGLSLERKPSSTVPTRLGQQNQALAGAGQKQPGRYRWLLSRARSGTTRRSLYASALQRSRLQKIDHCTNGRRRQEGGHQQTSGTSTPTRRKSSPKRQAPRSSCLTKGSKLSPIRRQRWEQVAHRMLAAEEWPTMGTGPVPS